MNKKYKFHCSQLDCGGRNLPIIVNMTDEIGRIVKELPLTRDELWDLKIEIERWFKTHSGICDHCGIDRGKHPNEN